MTGIKEASEKMKNKLSFDDYESSRVEVKTIHKKTEEKKRKASVYLSEDEISMLCEVLGKRLTDKKKADRSSLVGEAICLLHEREFGKK